MHTQVSKVVCCKKVLTSFSAHLQRQEMDRRRFEAAHLKYACLQMASRYPNAISISHVKVEGDVTDTLREITPSLFHCFETRYAGWSVYIIIVHN